MLAAPRDLASAQAAAMIAQVDQIRPGASTALAVDTLAVLSTWDDIDGQRS